MGRTRKKRTPRKNKEPDKASGPEVLPTQVQVVPERSTDKDNSFWVWDCLPANHVARPTVAHVIDICLHHGGKFTFDPYDPYVGGSSEVFKGWDIDKISSIEVGKLVTAVGYGKFKGIWYRHPLVDENCALKPLKSDEDVRSLCEDVKGYSIVDVYVEQCAESFVEKALELDLHGGDSDVEVVIVDVVVPPLIEPVVEPVAEPVVEPVADPVVEFVAEPLVEPVAEPVVEPVADPVVEPVAEPVVELVVEPF